MTPIELIVGFVISILANFVTSAVEPPIPNIFQRKLKEAAEDKEALSQALVSGRTLGDEVRKACKQLSQNRNVLGVSQQEVPIWLLLGDVPFQHDLTDWLMTGAIEEGDVVKERLSQRMEIALAQGGASPEQIDSFKRDYFVAIERAIFSSPDLAHWRYQLSLDYLRRQVTAVQAAAEKAAGIYSPKQKKAALDHYCEKALAAWDIIDLSNLPEGDIDIATQNLLLRQLYMPLRLTVEITRERSGDEKAFAGLEEQREKQRLWQAGRRVRSRSALTTRQKRSPVGERLGAARRLVVLGDPGGGKTTMMRWMATAYLLFYRDDPAYHQLPDVQTLPDERWIPVLIRCRDLGDADLCRSFPDFLTQHLRKTELLPEEADVMKAVILDSIAKGEALLLVDGLDEITNPQVRAMFCQELERTAVRYPDAPIVVTSRIVGYRDMPYRMGSGFEHSVIAELTRDDKDRFARRWVDVTEQHQPAAEKAKRVQELLDALHSNDRIERLTGNPMLLTTLALVKRKVGKLPSRRTKLYAEAVSVLLNWNPRRYPIIDENEAIPQLEFLAYEMCRQGVQRLSEDEVLDLLDRVRQEYPNIRAIRQRESQVFLALLEARSSILIKSGGQWLKQQGGEKPVWEFRHLTFQEYLAARALLDGRYPGRDRTKTLAEQVAPLAGSVKESRVLGPELELEVTDAWREPLRLLVVDCKDDDVDDVLRAIATPLPEEDAKKTVRPRVVLAARCLADEPNASEQAAEDVLANLAAQVSETDGRGVERTGLDDAAVELGHSLWTDILTRSLISEFQRRDPDDRWHIGGVLGMVGMACAPQDQHQFEIWFREVVARLNPTDAEEATAAALTIMDAAFHKRALADPKLVPSLLNLLPLSQPLCFSAAWALGWLAGGSRQRDALWKPQGDEVPVLLKALQDALPSENDTRRWLINVLGSCKDPRVTDQLIPILVDPNAPVRRAVVTALRKLADQRAVEPLLHMLEDPDTTVRSAVVDLLGKLADQRAVKPLLLALKDPSTDVRSAVVELLGKLADQQAVEPLLHMLEDPDTTVRSAVVNALGTLGDARAVEPLMDQLEDLDASVRGAVVKALATLGNTRAVEPLLGRLADPDAGVRRAVIKAVGKLKDQQATEPLLHMLEDHDASVCLAAAEVLASWGDVRGSAALVQFLDSSRSELRREAVRVFAQKRDKIECQLLSRDFDADAPWIDLHRIITEVHVGNASRRLRITPEEVRSHYESLAAALPLTLSWKNKPGG